MKQNTSRGFALLYALLVTTITLSASLLASNIIRRQLITTNVGGRGFVAYAAANDGLQCALLWDRWMKTWFDSSGDGILDSDFSSIGATCSAQSVVMTAAVTPPPECIGINKRQFTLLLHPNNRTTPGTLSDPSVTVYVCADNGGLRTFISRGSDTGDTSHPRRVVKTIKDTQ